MGFSEDIKANDPSYVQNKISQTWISSRNPKLQELNYNWKRSTDNQFDFKS
jgi:hypothetical protein